MLDVISYQDRNRSSRLVSRAADDVIPLLWSFNSIAGALLNASYKGCWNHIPCGCILWLYRPKVMLLS